MTGWWALERNSLSCGPLLVAQANKYIGMYRDITPIMENQMKKNMENEMDTAIYRVM